jgi:hypothetical protein
LGFGATIWLGKSATRGCWPSASRNLSQFSGFGTILDWEMASARNQQHRPKREITMSSQSQFTRTLVAIAAALTMSTLAVGAAVGPAQANANPYQAAING